MLPRIHSCGHAAVPFVSLISFCCGRGAIRPPDSNSRSLERALASRDMTVPGLTPQFGISPCPGSVAYGSDATPPTARARPSFRPRRAICLARLHHTTRAPRHSDQHEPMGNALRQCPSEKFHEDSQIRGSLPHRIARSGGSPALIKQFLEKVYNQQLFHSALGYRPPLEFERSLRPSPALEKRRA
jgi:hypothetical protein